MKAENCSAIIRFFYLIESCITLLYYRPHYILHTPSPRIGIAHTYVLSFRITYLICMYRVVNNCRVCVSKKLIKKRCTVTNDERCVISRARFLSHQELQLYKNTKLCMNPPWPIKENTNGIYWIIYSAAATVFVVFTCLQSKDTSSRCIRQCHGGNLRGRGQIL